MKITIFTLIGMIMIPKALLGSLVWERQKMLIIHVKYPLNSYYLSVMRKIAAVLVEDQLSPFFIDNILKI